jgi:WbqC-like protein family
LKWRGEVILTDKAIPFERDNNNDWRNQVLPKNYDRVNPLQYRQVFEERTGFLPNLSALDLLFNEGPRAGILLEKFAIP